LDTLQSNPLAMQAALPGKFSKSVMLW